MSSVPATIQVGSLIMSFQAFIVAAAGCLLGLVIFFIHPCVATAVAGMVTTGLFFLYAYNINCVVVGHCDVFSWVLVSLYLLLVCIQIAAALSNAGSHGDMSTGEIVNSNSANKLFEDRSPVMRSVDKVRKSVGKMLPKSK